MSTEQRECAIQAIRLASLARMNPVVSPQQHAIRTSLVAELLRRAGAEAVEQVLREMRSWMPGGDNFADIKAEMARLGLSIDPPEVSS